MTTTGKVQRKVLRESEATSEINGVRLQLS